MGIVYKAFDQELKRWVAIKFCASDVISDDYKNRFRFEAESIAAMKHPNIVKVFDVRDYEERPYMTMELIEDGSLDEHLDRYLHDSSRTSSPDYRCGTRRTPCTPAPNPSPRLKARKHFVAYGGQWIRDSARRRLWPRQAG